MPNRLGRKKPGALALPNEKQLCSGLPISEPTGNVSHEEGVVWAFPGFQVVQDLRL